MKKYSFYVLLALFVLVGAALPNKASAIVTTVSATVDGGSSVSVLPGASTTIAVTVQMTVMSNTWNATSYLISTTSPGTFSCANTNNHTGINTFVESFEVKAPTEPGIYNLYLQARGTNACGGNTGSLLTLTNAITVALPPPVEPDICFEPSSINPMVEIRSAPESELDLSQIFINSGYGSLGTSTDQKNFSSWSFDPDLDVELEATLLGKYAGQSGVFGYYLDENATNFVPLWNIGGNTDYPLINPVPTGSPLLFSVSPASSIGFAIMTQADTNPSVFYSTNPSLSADSSERHSAVYNSAQGEYLLAFEDLAIASSDKDFNDMVVKVKLMSCEVKEQEVTAPLKAATQVEDESEEPEESETEEALVETGRRQDVSGLIGGSRGEVLGASSSSASSDIPQEELDKLNGALSELKDTLVNLLETL